MTEGEKNRDKEIYGISSILIREHGEEALIKSAMRGNVIELFQPGFDGHLRLFICPDSHNRNCDQEVVY